MEASTPMQKAALCELRHVGHDFPLPRGGQVTVLEDIQLEVRPREVVALLGPSGCGKSTLLRILAGLVPPTRGGVLHHGAPLTGLNPGVGIVFQTFGLLPWMSVERNIEVVLEAAGLPSTECRERAGEALRQVGLHGFEEAYPRELSGGMRQRVGIARALSLGRELLFMDEPFSQVDALTAESLRAEVLGVWGAGEGSPGSILLVSHDIKEAVYMADRIVVLRARPGRVRQVVDNRLARPRDYRSPELLQLVDDLHDLITGSEIPDVPAPSRVDPGLVEPLPAATDGDIVGLLEYLDARGGREDVFRIAAETSRDFGTILGIVQAAELLGWVDTPGRQVVLRPEGLRFTRAPHGERRALWRDRLLGLRLFRAIDSALGRSEGQRIGRELVLDEIVLLLPSEDPQRTFETLVRWGRFGDLFRYDEGTGMLVKQAGATPPGRLYRVAR